MDKVLKLNASLSSTQILNASLVKDESLNANLGVKIITGDVNYETMVYNRPSINSVELIGNKISEELGLEPTIADITEQDIDKLIYGG